MMLSVLRACLSFLWRHKVATVIVAALISVCIYLMIMTLRARHTSDEYVKQLQNYEIVTKANETAWLQQTLRADLAEAQVADYAAQAGAQVAYHCEATIEYQTRTIRVPVAETKIVYRDRYIAIDGRVISDDGPDVAQSVTGLEMTYTIKPLALDLFVTRGPDGEYATIVDTHDPAITIGRMKTRLDPAVFHDDRHWFAGGGPLVRLRDFKVRDFGATDLGVAGQIGYTGGRWFVAAQVQYLDGFGVGLMAGGRF
jgi:hypothetical protein